LAGSDEAAEHPFDLAAFLAEMAISFGVKPSHIMGDPKLGLEFGE